MSHITNLQAQHAELTAQWRQLNRDGAPQAELDAVADKAQAVARTADAVKHAVATGRVTAHTAEGPFGGTHYLGHTLDGKTPMAVTAEATLALVQRLDEEYLETLTNGDLRGHAQDLEVAAELAVDAAITLVEARNWDWTWRAMEAAREAEGALERLLAALPEKRTRAREVVATSLQAAKRRVMDGEQVTGDAACGEMEARTHP